MKIDLEHLKTKIDMTGKYVDFSLIRTSLTVLILAEDVGTQLNEPNTDGEARADCPKCKKPRSFSLNTDTNRFNCFNKGCDLKGGGVIDFASKLFAVTAKEASHLLACAYGIQPYTADDSGAGQSGDTQNQENREVVAVKPEKQEINGFVSQSEFDELKTRFERLSNILFGFMLEHDADCHQDYEDGVTDHLVAH